MPEAKAPESFTDITAKQSCPREGKREGKSQDSEHFL